MVKRPFWETLIEQAWRRKPIVWLSGVRRAGKTLLCQNLVDTEYFDCELPRVRQMLEDPEGFLETRKKGRIVLDEVQRLPNPSELLKIAADHYPKLKILATGSSTLGTSAKFSDTLAGRKASVWLTPMLLQESKRFGESDIKHRMLYGGLPPFFMAKALPELDFEEWIDAYWARDIQLLFHLERRYSFQRLVELLFAQSGQIFEATRFAKQCEVSRQTIGNYLAVLETTFVVSVLRPFATGRATEIVSAPKVFGFDTGFVCHHRGWHSLRQDDLGLLWEHLTLNELQGNLQTRKIHYWRDKQHHEIDFVILDRKTKHPIAIECKWSARQFDPRALEIFRRIYPNGKNLVVANDVNQPFERKYHDLKVTFVHLSDLAEVF